ncbi:hypothetical protein COHA_010784, partial [Chlorella ohadii]
LLQQGVGAAQSVVDVTCPAGTSFADAQSAETQDRIFDELNTLSVVYRAPATTFIDAEQGAERFEQDSIDMGVPSSDKGEEAESALNAAQASLLDLADGGGPADADTPSSAAAAGGSGAAAGGNGFGDQPAGVPAELGCLDTRGAFFPG